MSISEDFCVSYLALVSESEVMQYDDEKNYQRYDRSWISCS